MELVVLAVLYFLPTIVVLVRKVKIGASIVVINLFLGWTFIGWVVALAMAVSAETKPLPPLPGLPTPNERS